MRDTDRPKGGAVLFRLTLAALLAASATAPAEEDFILHTGLLRERVAAAGKAGLKPRVRLKLAGGTSGALVLGTGEGSVWIEVQGNKLELAWRKLEEDEEYEVYRGCVKEDDAAGSFSLAVLAQRLDLPDLAEKYTAQALAADPNLRERVTALSRLAARRAPAKATASPVQPPAAPKPEAEKPRARGAPGPREKPGAPDGAKVVKDLRITSPGVYENLIIDGGFTGGSLVKIDCDQVTLRNCTIRNSTRNGVEVYGKQVTIERCLIHHLLAGTYKDQYDAHGITGTPNGLVIRDCEIHHVSGDSLQFDPDRAAWDDVLVEHCTFWTGPLDADAAGFKKGERPGENALDTKQSPKRARSNITVRHCHVHGFGQGQIANQAAFNLKDHVNAVIEDCVFAQNDICLRVRGPGRYGGATARIARCACYASKAGVRIEESAEQLKLLDMAFASDVRQKLAQVDGGAGKGFEHRGDRPAPPLAEALKTWGLQP